MRKLCAILLVAIFWLCAPKASGQSQIRIAIKDPVPADSADIAYYGKPHFWRATATVAGLNTSIWAFDRYVQNADFARISLHSIKENFIHGFIWDNDRLGTNMFLHPYHGNLYYNAGRSNGFNYWQSGLYAIGGSAMWELFLEDEYPSTNDIIATPIGGMAIGEVTYRASDMVLKDNSVGWERFGREAGVFLISPMRSLTRIINGDAWRYRATPGRQFGLPPISLEISAGLRMIEFEDKIFDRGAGITAEINAEYGDRFELSSTSPYDYFTFRANLNAQASQPVLSQLNIMGRLISRGIVDTRTNQVSVGLYQLYDFYDSDTISSKSGKVPYKLAVPASVGAAAMWRWEATPKYVIDAYAGFNGIFLGGILSDHYQLDERNYNLGSGFSIKSGINLVYDFNKASISGSYEYYRMYTWGYPRGTVLSIADRRTLNAEGDDSAAYFGIANVRTDYKVARHMYITADFTHYMRSTHYRDFPSVKSSSFAVRLMATYKF